MQGNLTVKNFFQVDENRGEISLKQSMLDFPDKNISQFEVNKKKISIPDFVVFYFDNFFNSNHNSKK